MKDQVAIRTIDSIVSEKIVTSEAGHSYKIKPVPPMSLMSSVGGLFDVSDLSKLKGKKPSEDPKLLAKLADPAAQATMQDGMAGIVKMGLVEPDPTQFEIWALGITEVGFLYGEIAALSGMSEQSGDEVVPFSEADQP